MMYGMIRKDSWKHHAEATAAAQEDMPAESPEQDQQR
jgi:hypothetical protein